MIKIVGVRFNQAGKIYYFDPEGMDMETGMHVIVETARGVEMGTVLIAPKEIEDDKVVQPLKPIIRIATEEDEKTARRNKEKAKEAMEICRQKIADRGLEMRLVNAEYTFDMNKLLFYFTADGRIDFRELVKDLAAIFRTRIELRQIGVRDETKLLGGMGICGRELCCHSYMADFVPVSIKMAKEQNLSLNPTKISGVCGRLMCCLKNEEETYEYLNRRLPSVGDTVTTPEGIRGEVSAVNVLRQLVKVLVDTGDEKELRDYPVNSLKFQMRRRKDVKLTEEELKELEGLEDHGDTDSEQYGANNSHQKRGARDEGGDHSRREKNYKENAGGKNYNNNRPAKRNYDGRGKRNYDRKGNNNRDNGQKQFDS